MALTLKQWKEILNFVEHSNNSNQGDILKQIREKLDIDTYQKWKQKNFDINYSFNTALSGQTSERFVLLHMAVINGNKAIVKYLINLQEIDVNLLDESGSNALHRATAGGHKEIVECLVVKGIDANKENRNGLTALHLAAINSHKEIVEYLIEGKNVNVNKADKNGFTALHWVAVDGHKEIVKYLIEEKGIDINLADKHGISALHLAAANSHKEVVEYLIEKSININKADKNGLTALHYAVINGHLDIVEYLVAKGADVNIINNNGKTALHLAAQFDELDVAKFLIAHEIKLKGSEVQKPDYLTEHREISEYWDKCLDELKRMKEEKIGGDITFYSILVSKSIDKLVCYIRNEQFTKVLERSNYRNKFPIYANDLDYLFKKAKQRVEALNIGEIVIKHFDGFSRGGPAHLKIAEYLSNEDLKNLRKAAIQTMDEEDVSKSLGSDVRVESAAKKQGMQT